MLEYYNDNGYKTREKLHLLLNGIHRSKINKNMPQIDREDGKFLKCPLYFYLKENYDKESDSMHELLSTEKFYEHFGSYDHVVNDHNELQ